MMADQQTLRVHCSKNWAVCVWLTTSGVRKNRNKHSHVCYRDQATKDAVEVFATAVTPGTPTPKVGRRRRPVHASRSRCSPPHHLRTGATAATTSRNLENVLGLEEGFLFMIFWDPPIIHTNTINSDHGLQRAKARPGCKLASH